MIEAVHLTKRFGDVDALRGIDLRVERGEFFGLFGPNGAGKTTMLRILTGIRKVDGLEARIARWFEFFDLEGMRGSLCKDLSKGTRQKLMLAAAFLHDPPLVFLDEPFINLDPIYQRKLKDFLAGYVKQGGTVFMASHLLDIAQKLCDRAGVIRDGSLIATGTLDEVRGAETDLESAFLRLVGA